MKATVLIPVKSLTSAKSRLTKYLTAFQKEKLVLGMLQHVIETIKKTDEHFEIFVVTMDPKIQNLAKSLNAKIISEKNPGQNRALTFAAKQLNRDIPLLTISADLPLLKTNDIKNLFLLMKAKDIVLAPSKEKTGTNAILMQRPMQVPYQFGKQSLDKFIHSAEKQKLRYQLYANKTIAFDIDTIQDMQNENISF
jgi:2-phospho-L-lactate guanylyltransferase